MNVPYSASVVIKMKICPINEDIANRNEDYQVCYKCAVESFEICKRENPTEYARWIEDNT